MISLPGFKCLYEFTVGESDMFRLGTREKETNVLWTIFVVLLVLWALGLLTGYTMGGVIHVLLVIAIIVVLVQVIQGRRRT
jgi:hypothetical protein